MRSLETMVPPPAVVAIVALAMWGVSLVAPRLQVGAPLRLLACAALVAMGLAFGIAGIRSFRRARTTASPKRPEAASSLVRSGIYRVTRNPMYVGLVFVLIGWAVFLSSPWALIGPLAFVLYIDRFQIAPEERALSKRFGAEYTAYKAEVRRWL